MAEEVPKPFEFAAHVLRFRSLGTRPNEELYFSRDAGLMRQHLQLRQMGLSEEMKTDFLGVVAEPCQLLEGRHPLSPGRGPSFGFQRSRVKL
jgi:hypothetical protein